MNHLYNIIIELVDKLILPIFSLFSKKINRFRINRIDLIEKIKNELIDKNENIWFHAASLGEYEIAVPIIKEIKKKYECNIVLTFFSESGFKLKKRIKEIDNTFYLPLDTKKNTKRFIDLINPKVSIFIKSEIWPNYLTEIRKKNIKSFYTFIFKDMNNRKIIFVLKISSKILIFAWYKSGNPIFIRYTKPATF